MHLSKKHIHVIGEVGVVHERGFWHIDILYLGNE